jgi:hypothetical protein
MNNTTKTLTLPHEQLLLSVLIFKLPTNLYKMKYYFYCPLITVLLIFLFQSVSAQNFYKEKFSRNHYYQIGIGVGSMYGDNAGRVRSFETKINPAFALSMGKKIHNLIDLRGYLGYQRFSSQDIEYFNPSVINTWQVNDQAVQAKGNIIFLDIMPTLHLFKSASHTQRRKFDIYGGAGIGVLLNLSKETRLVDGTQTTENKTRPIGYIPLRGGISYKLDLYSDISLEGTLMLTFSDEIDGNTGFNRFNDHLVNGKIVYRRYLSNIKSTTY